MKRLVIDARESGTSTGRYVDKLIEYLGSLEPGLELSVLTKPPRVEFIQQIAPNFKVLESSYKEFTFAEQLGLLRQLRGLSPNLVHFSMTQQPVLYWGKSLTTVHDLTTARFYNPAKNRVIFKLKQWVYRAVIFWIAHKSLELITPSQWVKKDLANFARLGPDKVVVTYEAADKIAEPVQKVQGLAPNNFIMYVGRPQPHKNLDRLVTAFSQLKKNHPQLKLVLVGKKDVLYERLEEKATNDQIPDVVFTDFAGEGQLRWLYENCAAYVFPSLSEGFGLPGLEAMAHGAPVVSSNATCLPEIYGQAARYFDPKDITDMASKIAEVLDDPSLRQRLIEAGSQQADKYSWRRMAEQTLEVYKKQLGQPK